MVGMNLGSKALARGPWGGLAVVALVCASLGCAKKGDLPPADTPPSPTAADEPPPPADMSCGMRILSAPPTEILVDGKSVGVSPVTVERLKPGMHDVTFVDEDNGNVTLQVPLAEGEFREVVHNLPPKATDVANEKNPKAPDATKEKK
jgi:hypothetical protein